MTSEASLIKFVEMLFRPMVQRDAQYNTMWFKFIFKRFITHGERYVTVSNGMEQGVSKSVYALSSHLRYTYKNLRSQRGFDLQYLELSIPNMFPCDELLKHLKSLPVYILFFSTTVSVVKILVFWADLCHSVCMCPISDLYVFCSRVCNCQAIVALRIILCSG